MKKHLLSICSVLALVVLLGFAGTDNPKSKVTFNYSGPSLDKNRTPITTDNNNPNSNAVAYYSDHFDLANDTSSLKARGYLVYYRGEGPQGIMTWFQGNGVFPAYDGDDTSYVAANFQVVGDPSGVADIDSWLVLPDLDVVAGDSIIFRCRSVDGNIYPDSVRVMYNDQGGATPESPGWVELGRFEANPSGIWEERSYVAPTSGLSARFAIRYAVVNGGPFGDNSNFMGIDALEVHGQGLLPVELSSFVSVVTSNNVTLKWTTVTELNNSGFDIERGVNGTWTKIGFVNGNGTSTAIHNYEYTDNRLNTGSYNYRLKQIDFNGNFEYHNLSNEVLVGVPVSFSLSQNYPNPFNPTTKIDFQLPSDGNINLSVFDNSGREVMNVLNEFKSAGYYSVNVNASSLSSGIYFYKISSGNFSAVKKMMLIK